MKFDSYTIKARFLPAFFSIILPIIIFNHFYISEEFSKFVGEIFGIKIFSNITFSAVSLFFLSEIGRLFGKNIFEKIFFRDEKKMPTTNFLLYKDKTYSDDFKDKFIKKIKSDFDIDLPNKEMQDSDEELIRTKIVETMALIRKKLMTNKFLLKHNIEYGSFRNAIGGSVLGVLFSGFNILFFQEYLKNELAVKINIFLLVCYSLLIIFSKVIINFYGRNYAKILFREYMGK